MNRDEIIGMVEDIIRKDTDPALAADEIINMLEDIGFDSDASAVEAGKIGPEDDEPQPDGWHFGDRRSELDGDDVVPGAATSETWGVLDF